MGTIFDWLVEHPPVFVLVAVVMFLFMVWDSLVRPVVRFIRWISKK